VPLRFCQCQGCPGCPPGRRTHAYDRDSSPGHQRCQPCQQHADNARYARRGTTSQRGYGPAHQRARAEAVAAFEPGQPCARCGQPVWDADDADLGHTDDRTGYRGLEHAGPCNRRAGAQSKRAVSRPVPAPEPEADDDGEDDDNWIGIA